MKKTSGSPAPGCFLRFYAPMQRWEGQREPKSDRTGDLAAAEAPSAGIHVDRLAVYDRLDTLNIGLPGPIRTPMRMADLDAERNALVTEFAFCHLPHLLKRIAFVNS